MGRGLMKLAKVSSIALAFLVLAKPVCAYQRVALIVDLAAPSTTSDLAKELSEYHGFDVTVVARAGDAARAVETFESHLSGAEFALAVVVGRMVHDKDGTVAELGINEKGAGDGAVSLIPLFDQLAQKSRSAIVVLQDLEKGSTAATRKVGAGRLPQIDKKLAIALVPPAIVTEKSISSALLGAARSARAQPFFVPRTMLSALRETYYLQSKGQIVPRLLGSLPDGDGLTHPRERSRVVELLWERARRLCEAAGDKTPANEQKLLSHYATSVTGLRTAALTDNDTFSLEQLARLLGDENACPIAPPTQAAIPPPEKSKPEDKGSSKNPSEPETETKKTALKPPKLESNGQKIEERKGEEPKKQPKATVKPTRNDDDDERRSHGTSRREERSTPRHEAPQPRSSPPPSPSPKVINTPNF